MRTLGLFITIFLLTDNPSVFGQNGRSMLITEISGNKYEKKSYDKGGSIKSYQMFHLGTIESKGKYYELPMKTYSYDRNKQLKDSAETRLRCDFENSNLNMNIFPFAEKAVNKTVILSTEGSHLIYPKNPETDNELETVEFVMAIDGGVLDLFGSRTVIKLLDRKVIADQMDKSKYVINSTMTIKSYLIGIRILAITYRVEELISNSKGILEQKFTEPTGAYFTLKLM